jgi:hypothetical protein
VQETAGPTKTNKHWNRKHLLFFTKYSPFLLLLAILLVTGWSVQAADRQVERGKYLVSVIRCTDCHTPGALLGKPDMTRYLAGSQVGVALPGLGVFYGPNLTPDNETGLGNWTIEEIATAIRTGKRPDGRKLAPITRWHHSAI